MCDNSEEISTFITIIKTKELVSSDIIIYMKRPNNVQFMCVRTVKAHCVINGMDHIEQN